MSAILSCTPTESRNSKIFVYSYLERAPMDTLWPRGVFFLFDRKRSPVQADCSKALFDRLRHSTVVVIQREILAKIFFLMKFNFTRNSEDKAVGNVRREIQVKYPEMAWVYPWEVSNTQESQFTHTQINRWFQTAAIR